MIKPVREKKVSKIKDHPFFGMTKDSKETVLEELANLRKSRNDI